MKRILCIVVAVFGLTAVNAQDINFGVKAGVDLATAKTEISGFSISSSETGFYIGGLAEIGLSDKLAFQPEVLYVSIEEFDQLSIPLMVKFLVSEKFNLLAGPSLSYLLDSEEGMKSLNYAVEGGAAFNITENFFVEARYNYGLANLIEDAPSGFSSKISGLFLGVGYKF